MANTRERVLCPHCLESFHPDDRDEGPLCPPCNARAEARTAPPRDTATGAGPAEPIAADHPRDPHRREVGPAVAETGPAIEGFGPAAWIAFLRRELHEARAW